MQLTIFSDDWGRHPSSCQHLVQQMLDRYPVIWVNTIGTRRVAFDAYSLQRGIEKLGDWLARQPASSSVTGQNPTVLKPVMWPSFGSSLGRVLNARLLTRAVSGHLPSSEHHVAITTLPVTADLIGRLPVSRWVYYCVDNLSEWPGLDKPVLERMERDLLEKVDAVVAVSETLTARLRSFGRDAHLLTHGVDAGLWNADTSRPAPVLEGLTPPYVVFWGVVDRRLDSGCIRSLSEALTTGSIVLVGPHNNPDPALRALANVHLTGPVDYQELPHLAAAASVLIMPYLDAAVTRAMQPLKLMEYLATGKPVVCRNLPAVDAWRDTCHVYDRREQFVSLVLASLQGEAPAAQLRHRQRLSQESWAHKARQFETLLAGRRSRPET